MGVGVCAGDARERIVNVFGSSYLASRDKLQRAQRSLQVRDIVLEVSQRLSRILVLRPPLRTIERMTCAGDAGLDLRRVLPGRAVGRDLVQRVGGHFDGLMSGRSR